MEPYVYQPLAERASIRIIALEPSLQQDAALQCEVIHSNRDMMLRGGPGLVSYEPVSYTWGEQPTFSSSLLCGQQRIAITPNVERILRHLRKPTRKRFLWIDAISLNQADAVEKAEQVPLMAEIFAQGRKTHICLDFVEPKTREFMMLRRLAYFDGNDMGPARMSEYFAEGEVLLLRNFLHHPWFARRWILQEVAASTNAIVRTHQESMPWKSFASAVILLRRIGESIGFRVDQRAHDAIQVIRNLLRLPEQTLDVWQALFEFHIAECSQPSDRVYSLYGLSRMNRSGIIALGADYRISHTEVYTGLVETSLASSIPGFSRQLCTNLRKHLVHFGSLFHVDGSLPSWVPDWSHSILRHLHARIPEPSVAPSPQNNTSIWVGLQLAEITEVFEPLGPFDRIPDLARHLAAINTQLGSSAIMPTDRDGVHGARSKQATLFYEQIAEDFLRCFIAAAQVTTDLSQLVDCMFECVRTFSSSFAGHDDDKVGRKMIIHDGQAPDGMHDGSIDLVTLTELWNEMVKNSVVCLCKPYVYPSQTPAIRSVPVIVPSGTRAGDQIMWLRPYPSVGESPFVLREIRRIHSSNKPPVDLSGGHHPRWLSRSHPCLLYRLLGRAICLRNIDTEHEQGLGHRQVEIA